MTQFPDSSEPCYVISVAAKMVGLPPQTLRYYERVGLVHPTRTRGRVRLYCQREIERLRRVKTLMSDMGINLAGAEVVLRLLERIQELEERLEQAQAVEGTARLAKHRD